MGQMCMAPKNQRRVFNNRMMFQKIEHIKIENEEYLEQKISGGQLLQLKKHVSKGLETGKIKIEENQLLMLKKQISTGKIRIQDLVSLSRQISASTQDTVENIKVLKLQHNCSQLEMQELCCEDFFVIQKLGNGAFGEVFLVKYKYTNKLSAIKIISKSDVLLYNMTKNVQLEKQLLLENKKNNSQFLLQLEASFQTPTKLYLLTEYMKGGDLFNLLQKKIQLKESIVKFYLAEIILALEEIHNRNLIYRDLKPENILLQQNGHLKLADFGLCKQLKNKTEKSYTMCGTTEYQAPEMIMKQGYNQLVDYWALGILCYELLMGHPPFRDIHRNQAKISQQILNSNITFNKTCCISRECKHFIQCCTKLDIEQRLGYQGVDQIKQHQFFKDIDWNKLSNQEYEPPFVIQTTVKNINSTVSLKESCLDGKVHPKIIGFSYNKVNDIQVSPFKISI